MLVIARKRGQSVRIGDIVLKVVGISRGEVRLGIDAPPETPIVRSEIVFEPSPVLSNGHRLWCASVTMKNRDCDCEP